MPEAPEPAVMNVMLSTVLPAGTAMPPTRKAVPLASAVVWVGRRRWFPGHRVKVRLAATYGPWFFTVAALGAFFVLMRLAESPILPARVLWLACLFGLAGLAFYLLRYLRVGYALEVAAFERDELRRRFSPRPKARRKRR